MESKPSRPKSAQTNTAARPAAKPTHKPENIPVYPPLSPLQEELLDLAGDLILRGGHEDDVTDLLYATQNHHWRRRFADNEFATDAKRTETTEHWVSSMKLDLARDWPRSKGKPAEVEPETARSASEQLRSRVRDNVRYGFEEFMATATPEEIRLLGEVFTTYWSISNGDGDKVQLAEAFDLGLGRNADYFRVPKRHGKLVAEYIALLEKGRAA